MATAFNDIITSFHAWDELENFVHVYARARLNAETFKNSGIDLQKDYDVTVDFISGKIEVYDGEVVFKTFKMKYSLS